MKNGDKFSKISKRKLRYEKCCKLLNVIVFVCVVLEVCVVCKEFIVEVGVLVLAFCVNKG